MKYMDCSFNDPMKIWHWQTWSFLSQELCCEGEWMDSVDQWELRYRYNQPIFCLEMIHSQILIVWQHDLEQMKDNNKLGISYSVLTMDNTFLFYTFSLFAPFSRKYYTLEHCKIFYNFLCKISNKIKLIFSFYYYNLLEMF